MANSMTTFKRTCYRLRLKLPVTQSVKLKNKNPKMKIFPWLADWIVSGSYFSEVFGLLNAAPLTTIFGMMYEVPSFCLICLWLAFTMKSAYFLFFLAFDFCRFCVVIMFFIPATTANDLRLRRIFYPRFYLFSCLNSWEKPVFSLLNVQC